MFCHPSNEDFSCVFWTSCDTFDRRHASSARYSNRIIKQMARDNGDSWWTCLRLGSPSLRAGESMKLGKIKLGYSFSLSFSLSLYLSLSLSISALFTVITYTVWHEADSSEFQNDTIFRNLCCA